MLYELHIIQNENLTWGIWISCLICKLDTEEVMVEPEYWPNVTASPANMANWWWLLAVADVTTPPRNVCTAICRWRIICNFLALSRLYMGPNLFRPPRILSARTAEKIKKTFPLDLSQIMRKKKLISRYLYYHRITIINQHEEFLTGVYNLNIQIPYLVCIIDIVCRLVLFIYLLYYIIGYHCYQYLLFIHFFLSLI